MENCEKDNKERILLGKQGEDIAVQYLLHNGFNVIERNFRAGRLGEIDIVASEAEYICFVEVKTRTGKSFGLPSEAVNSRKQSKIRSLAWIYLKQHGLQEHYIRFDIVEVLGCFKNGLFSVSEINLIKNAF